MNQIDPFETVVENCRTKIRRYGVAVIGVGANPDLGTPQFAYTVGVSTLRGFEFVISGLPLPTMQTALNTLARKARSGELRPVPDLLVEGVFGNGYVPRLRSAHPRHRFGMIRQTLDPVVMPMVWQAQFPDRERRYPGDPGCTLTPADQTDFTLPPTTPSAER